MKRRRTELAVVTNANRPTEEDVLAMTVLCAIINEHDCEDGRDFALEETVMAFGDDPPELADRIRPAGVLEIARSRRRDERPWTEVVADSERRLEVERAKEAILALARVSGHYLTDYALSRAFNRVAQALIDAEAVR